MPSTAGISGDIPKPRGNDACSSLPRKYLYIIAQFAGALAAPAGYMCFIAAPFTEFEIAHHMVRGSVESRTSIFSGSSTQRQMYGRLRCGKWSLRRSLAHHGIGRMAQCAFLSNTLFAPLLSLGYWLPLSARLLDPYRFPNEPGA